MDSGDFEWDEAKSALNKAKHGVSLAEARFAFGDPFAIDWHDGRYTYGEDRFILLGMATGRLLYVAFTMRGEVIRIISARGAEPYEQRRYHEANS